MGATPKRKKNQPPKARHLAKRAREDSLAVMRRVDLAIDHLKTFARSASLVFARDTSGVSWDVMGEILRSWLLGHDDAADVMFDALCEMMGYGDELTDLGKSIQRNFAFLAALPGGLAIFERTNPDAFDIDPHDHEHLIEKLDGDIAVLARMRVRAEAALLADRRDNASDAHLKVVP